MTEHKTLHKVVVIGGGYAGTLAANRLRARDDVVVTLVNPRPEFVERIRLHQYVARTGDATIDYGTLLGEGVHLVVDKVTRVDTAARRVVSLGRRAGIRQLARKDDTAVNVFIGGRMGAVIKEVTCKFVVAKRIRLEARRPGSMTWPTGGPRLERPASAARVVISP
ncbi:FAD-dependent oxidoreductase [Microbispora hainanensis]|uniref:FAD/NAD(P)-binding domain-containing protein n=1 Tax=Microbispora hainanensis TaxID=568844 RepID=A0A544Z223_9ACTN|nr:FAD-dependent oxidoreductase [Microbispora hainanensis]TQS22672.1 hypothetical protein FLX08_07485 [Microbispora hainanensis]